MGRTTGDASDLAQRVQRVKHIIGIEHNRVVNVRRIFLFPICS